MRSLSFVLAASLAAASPTLAAEEWLVVKDGENAWGFDKGGMSKDPDSGVLYLQIGRYTSAGQFDGPLAYYFEMRRYELSCERVEAKEISRTLFRADGRPYAPGFPNSNAPWKPATSGWSAQVKEFACDGAGLDDAVKAPNRIAAMALMVQVAK